MPEDFVSRFRSAYEGSSAAFNQGDLDEALGALPEDLEWHAPSEDPEHTVYRGPAEITGWFRDMQSVFDEWRVEVQGVEQLSDNAVLVEHVISGTSRGAGVPVDVVTYEFWEFGPLDTNAHPAWDFVGKRPVRVRQFLSREEALAAAAEA
jgi:ketosteroid isomerase-like protein